MAAGPVGTCWAQTPAWSLTGWTALSWSGAVIVPTQTGIHSEGGGSSRLYGVPRKRRRKDPEFTLRKDKPKPEPMAEAVSPTAVVEPEVEGIPEVAAPLDLPPMETMPARKAKRERPVSTFSPEAALAQQREVEDQEDEEALLAYLMSL